MPPRVAVIGLAPRCLRLSKTAERRGSDRPPPRRLRFSKAGERLRAASVLDSRRHRNDGGEGGEGGGSGRERGGAGVDARPGARLDRPATGGAGAARVGRAGETLVGHPELAERIASGAPGMDATS